MTSRKAYQVLVALLGLVAFANGVLAVLLGVDLIPGPPVASADVDTELRFHAAWYAAAGVLLWKAVPRIEAEGTLIAVLSGAAFFAACGRVLSIAAVGAPHPRYLALMGIEFALPFVLIPWQRALARNTT